MQTYRNRNEAIEEAKNNFTVLDGTSEDPRRYILRLKRRYAEVPFNYDLWLQQGDTIVGMIERDGNYLSFTGK